VSLEMQNDFNLKNTKHCVHTKNIYSLMDIPHKEDSYKRFAKHLESCRQCSEQFKIFKFKNEAAQIYIPKVHMDRDLRQSFEREVSELFKLMNLNERQALKRNVKNKLQQIDSIGLSIIENFTSKRMVKAYLMGLFIFLGLKFFF